MSIHRWMDKEVVVHIHNGIFVAVVQLLSHVRLFETMDCSMPGFPVLHSFLEFAPTQVPLSLWCHANISSSAVPFFSCPQSFPTSGPFPMSNHKKKCTWHCSNEVDEPGVCYTEWSKSEREKQYTYWCIYVEPRIMVLMNLLHGRNRNTDVKKRLVDTVGKGESWVNWENSTDKYTAVCKTIIRGKQLYNIGN